MMTLDRYMEKLRVNVEAFEKDWRAHQTDALAKLQWPDELESEVDWDEQFIMFLGQQPGE